MSMMPKDKSTLYTLLLLLDQPQRTVITVIAAIIITHQFAVIIIQ
jgi:hypothetical protein